MPIKKDDKGNRWVEMELLVPGTPEQVWHAMATGQGYAAWFTPGEIEPREGGLLRFDFGEGGETSGEVTRWDPPHHFGYVEREWGEGAPPVATEITIVARANNQCVVRMVHSLFSTTDDWDDQVEGFEAGWPGFFAVLRIYLKHFAVQAAGSFMAMAPSSEDSLTAWSRMANELGLAGANVGERRSATSSPEAWSGVVELVHQDDRQRYVLLRLEAPSPGVLLVGTHEASSAGSDVATHASVCRYFYGDDASSRARASESAWRDWLAKTVR